MSSSSQLPRLVTQHFDERYKRKQSESFLSQPEHTICISKHKTFRYFSLKAVYKSCKLQKLFPVAKVLFMYSFTHMNIAFLIKIFWTAHSRPFIRYQSKNLDFFWIWCCFQFFLHCLIQPNQVIHFLFHVIFIIRIRCRIFQTVNLYFVCFWNIALQSFHKCV